MGIGSLDLSINDEKMLAKRFCYDLEYNYEDRR